MTESSFSLVPFPDPDLPAIKITGRVTRNNNLLTVHYEGTGRLTDIRFPDTSIDPSRKDDLWKSTCFEFFLAHPNQPHYWEFNMSPSGDWNIYHMDAYRRVGFKEEASIQQLPFSICSEDGRFSMDVSVDLTPIIHAEEVVQASITSIIQTKADHESYWALVHPNAQADFHLRESFIIRL